MAAALCRVSELGWKAAVQDMQGSHALAMWHVLDMQWSAPSSPADKVYLTAEVPASYGQEAIQLLPAPFSCYWPLPALTLVCKYLFIRNWTVGTTCVWITRHPKAFKPLLTWLDWIFSDCASLSPFFFSQTWLMRHNLDEFQAIRKAEGRSNTVWWCLFVCFFVFKKGYKVSWIYNSLAIGPCTWALMLFSENRSTVRFWLRVEDERRAPLDMKLRLAAAFGC